MNAGRVRPLLLLLTMFLAVGMMAPRAAAQDAFPNEPSYFSTVDLHIWGLSYHIARDRGYNENNWGIGLRVQRRPPWEWLGDRRTTRVFLETDVMANSYGGVIVPTSIGLDYAIARSRRCALYMSGALTLAYYHKPTDDSTEFRYGPVPGFAVGCGRLKSNVVVLFSPSSQILDGFAGFITIGLH